MTALAPRSSELSPLARGTMRDIRCPRCGGYLGKTTATAGLELRYCRNSECRKWRLIDVATGREATVAA